MKGLLLNSGLLCAPGNTEWERFDNAMRKVLTVPKEDFVKEEARMKAAKEKKKLAGKR